jgi:hypothetical protein
MVASGSALAADFPAYRAPVLGYNWTGFYAGVNVGEGWSEQRDSNVSTSSDGTFANPPGIVSTIIGNLIFAPIAATNAAAVPTSFNTRRVGSLAAPRSATTGRSGIGSRASKPTSKAPTSGAPTTVRGPQPPSSYLLLACCL